MSKFCILSDSGHPCSHSIRWLPDGFFHSALHRPEQILSVKRSCPFLRFKLLYTSLTRKLLFWKAVHIRMSHCTFRQRQGHASGIIIGNEVGVVCRILCYSEMQKLSCVQGFCAAPCGPENHAVCAGQHKLAGACSGYLWCGSPAPAWATPSWSGSLNSTQWSTYGLPFLRYIITYWLITCSMNPNKADATCVRLLIPQMQCLLKGSQYKVGGLRDLHLKLMALYF